MPTLLLKINSVIINPAIIGLFAVALVYFLYGVFLFIRGADDESARSTGRDHILWGLVGMFIMIAVFGIIRVTLNTFGVNIPDSIVR